MSFALLFSVVLCLHGSDDLYVSVNRTSTGNVSLVLKNGTFKDAYSNKIGISKLNITYPRGRGEYDVRLFFRLSDTENVYLKNEKIPSKNYHKLVLTPRESEATTYRASVVRGPSAGSGGIVKLYIQPPKITEDIYFIGARIQAYTDNDYSMPLLVEGPQRGYRGIFGKILDC